ncbi:MAG: DUF6653 family protein [Pseudomonadota bacterium]
MDIFRGAERLMVMDDATWARHANPWSVWTRFSCLPLLVLGIWSRDWIGWWALVPVAAALLWTWLNPRVFAPPARLDTWPGFATRGERLFLNRHAVPIPRHHLLAAYLLTGLTALGAMILLWGVVWLDVWSTMTGLALTMVLKVWFCDRMAWLYLDLRSTAGSGS